jgi:hypothetical protein
MYASEFGDPVSMMIYRTPNNEQFKSQAFSNYLQLAKSFEGKYLFVAASENRPLLYETAACASVIDIDFYRQQHPDMFHNKNVLPHAYYLLDASDTIGMIAGDAIIHDSAESWRVVRAKITWRLNNALNETDVSESGFSGRSHNSMYSPQRQKIRFLLYCATIVWPLKDAIWLSVTRKRLGYIHHFFLTYFVVFKTVQMKLRNLTGHKVSEKRYGEN